MLNFLNTLYLFLFQHISNYAYLKTRFGFVSHTWVSLRRWVSCMMFCKCLVMKMLFRSFDDLTPVLLFELMKCCNGSFHFHVSTKCWISHNRLPTNTHTFWFFRLKNKSNIAFAILHVTSQRPSLIHLPMKLIAFKK